MRAADKQRVLDSVALPGRRKKPTAKGIVYSRASKADDDGKAPRRPTSYRADVDGLRALAVSAVVAYHLDKDLLPGGFVGVDCFFVISGFVVCGSLLRGGQHDSLSSFLIAFYARRVKRLAPALWCVVFAASAATSLLLTPLVAQDLADYYLTAAFGLIGWANNHFAARGTAYSDQGPLALEYNPFTHLWSLGV